MRKNQSRTEKDNHVKTVQHSNICYNLFLNLLNLPLSKYTGESDDQQWMTDHSLDIPTSSIFQHQKYFSQVTIRENCCFIATILRPCVTLRNFHQTNMLLQLPLQFVYLTSLKKQLNAWARALFSIQIAKLTKIKKTWLFQTSKLYFSFNKSRYAMVVQLHAYKKTVQLKKFLYKN